nr:unnamed protein product [Callosobruchus chinensis]
MNFALFTITLGRLHSRCLQRAANALTGRQKTKMLLVPSGALEECAWWLENLEKSCTLYSFRETVLITADASDLGWEAQIGGKLVSGTWEGDQIPWHINKKDGGGCSPTSLSAQPSTSEKQKSHCSVRQQKCHCLHKEPRRDEIFAAHGSCRAVTRSVPRESDRHNSSIYPEHVQRCSRQFIQMETPGGLAPVQGSDQSYFPQVGHPRDRPFRHQKIEGSPSLCFQRCQRQAGSIHRCFQQNMAIQVSMDIPATISDTTRSISSQQDRGNVHNNSSPMGKGVLESRPQSESNKSTFPNSELTTSHTRCIDRVEPSQGEKPSFGGLEGTGWSKITSTWAKDDQLLTERAWRKSSMKTYSAPWKTWLERCTALSIDPNAPTASTVAQHLGYLHRVRKLSSDTIKVHKSAIATLADPLQRDKITNSLLVKQMLKAIELERPRPTKKCIWDVSRLITWLESVNVNVESVFQVSRHLALILLLASGGRIHDLTLLGISEDSMSLEDQSVSFWPKFGSKTDKRSYRQSGWNISKIPIPQLDPVYWTNTLLSVTAHRRGPVDSLFITSRGRVGPASRAVISG